MIITAEPRSDQWNADDFIGGPRDFTIQEVIPGTAEQKYDIRLEGETRVWRPPLTVLRLLIACWGDDGKQWAGRRVRLHLDPTVTFGKAEVGGIRVSHVSHIDSRQSYVLSVSRGRKAKFVVDPLPLPAPSVSDEEIESADVEGLRALWSQASPTQQNRIRERVAELQGGDA